MVTPKPGHAGLMASCAGTDDAGVIHRRSRTEGREIRRRMTGFACGFRRNVRCRRRLGHDIRKAQARCVALRAIGGDAGMAHREHRVIVRVRMAGGAWLRRRNVISPVLR